jgi:hypothetical protein
MLDHLCLQYSRSSWNGLVQVLNSVTYRPTTDDGFLKLTSDRFCGNRPLKMNMHFCCSTLIFRNNPPQCTTITFCQCWFSRPVTLRWCCLPMFHACRRNLSLSIRLIIWCSCWSLNNDLSSFRTEQVSHSPSLSHGLSLITITSSLTRALQGVNKRKKNIPRCQLKFFQCSQQNNLYS